MTIDNTWGTLGNTVFKFLTSPVYGTVRRNDSARYTEYQRILVRDPQSGFIRGQRPLRQPAGLELSKVSFDCKISAVLLFKLEQGLLERIARGLGAGAIAGSKIGSTELDTRFYTDVEVFINELRAMHESQAPYRLFIGQKNEGLFTLDSLSQSLQHEANGKIKTATLSLELVEWAEV